MPQMEDPNFKATLTYVLDHGEHGALGFVINRSIGIDMQEVYTQMKIVANDNAELNAPVMEGGPVDREHGLVLHESGTKWPSSKHFGHGISISSSREVLEAMARGEGPNPNLMLLGHSGWGPGQLEEEMAQNAWLNCPAETDILFNADIDQKLPAAARLLGIDLNHIVTQAGHA